MRYRYSKIHPGLLDLVYQGMIEDIDTKEKAAHNSYKNMEQLDFQIMLTDNYYVNPNSIHLFPHENKKKQQRKQRHRRGFNNRKQLFHTPDKRNKYN